MNLNADFVHWSNGIVYFKYERILYELWTQEHEDSYNRKNVKPLAIS